MTSSRIPSLSVVIDQGHAVISREGHPLTEADLKVVQAIHEALIRAGRDGAR